MSSLPDNNINVNIKSYVLDPFTVIIKLAILANKPHGTKLLIRNNTIYFQEPGVMQMIYRIYYNSNKTDLQYLYNPIYIACENFLSNKSFEYDPRMKELFMYAQKGIKKISDTYKNCSIISICLNYYDTIIKNYVEEKYNESIFQKDSMSSLYTKELVQLLNKQWTSEKIKIILDLIIFLINDNMANENVKSLENIVENIDKENYIVITEQYK
jgi:hypothetical protein